MKIAIPVNDDKITVCVSFGRPPLFALMDTESGTMEYLKNSAAESQGGAGIKAAQFLVDQGAEAVLTPRCGENAAEVLNAAKVALYKTNSDSVADNIAAFKAGKLSSLSQFHAGFHNHGGI